MSLTSAVNAAVNALSALPRSETALHLLGTYPRLSERAIGGLSGVEEPRDRERVGDAMEALRTVVQVARVSPQEDGKPSECPPLFHSVRCWILCRYLRRTLEQVQFGSDLRWDEARKWCAVARPDPVKHSELSKTLECLYDRLPNHLKTETLKFSLKKISTWLSQLAEARSRRYADLSALVHSIARFVMRVDHLKYGSELSDILSILAPDGLNPTSESLGKWSWDLHRLSQKCMGISTDLCRDPFDSLRMECVFHRRKLWESTIHRVMECRDQLLPRPGMIAAPSFDPNHHVQLRALQVLIGPLEALERDPVAWPDVHEVTAQFSYTSTCSTYYGCETVSWATFFGAMRANKDQENFLNRLKIGLDSCWNLMSYSQKARVIEEITGEYRNQLRSGRAMLLDPCAALFQLLEEILASPQGDQRAALLKEWGEICAEVGLDPNSGELSKILSERARPSLTMETEEEGQPGKDMYDGVRRHVQEALQQYNVDLFQTLLWHSSSCWQTGMFAKVVGRFIGAFRLVDEQRALQDPLRWLDQVMPHHEDLQRALRSQLIAGMIEMFLCTPPHGLQSQPTPVKEMAVVSTFEETDESEDESSSDELDPSWMETHPQRDDQAFVLSALEQDPSCLWYIDPILWCNAPFMEKVRPYCARELDLADAPGRVFLMGSLLPQLVAWDSGQFLAIPPEYQTEDVLVLALKQATQDHDAMVLGSFWSQLLQHAGHAVLQKAAQEILRQLPELWTYLQIQDEAAWGPGMDQDRATWKQLHQRLRPEHLLVLQQVSCSSEEALSALEALQTRRPLRSPLEDPIRRVLGSHVDCKSLCAARRLLLLHRDYWMILPQEIQQHPDFLLMALSQRHDVWGMVPQELWKDRNFVWELLRTALKAQVSVARAMPLIDPELYASSDHLLFLLEGQHPSIHVEVWPYVAPELWANADFVLASAHALDHSIEASSLREGKTMTQAAELVPVQRGGGQRSFISLLWEHVQQDLWKDRAFVTGVAEVDPRRALKTSFQEEDAFVHEILRRDGGLIMALPAERLRNLNFWKIALRSRGDLLSHLKNSLPMMPAEQAQELCLMAVQSDVEMIQHVPAEMWQGPTARPEILRELFRQRSISACLIHQGKKRLETPLSKGDAAIVLAPIGLLTAEQWSGIPDETIRQALQGVDYMDLGIFKSSRACRIYGEALLEGMSEAELRLVGCASRGAPYQQDATDLLRANQPKAAVWDPVPPDRWHRLERLHTFLEALPAQTWNSPAWQQWVMDHLPDALLPRIPSELYCPESKDRQRIKLWDLDAFVERAVQRYGILLERASERQKKNPRICAPAVDQDWHALAFCKINQTECPEVSRSAMGQDLQAVQWVDSLLPEYLQWAQEALKKHPYLLACIAAPHGSNLFLLQIVMRCGPGALVHMPESAWGSICVAWEGVRRDAIEDPERKGWIDLARALLKARPSWFEHFPDALREDPEWQQGHLIALQKCAEQDPRTLIRMGSYEWNKILAAWESHQVGACSEEGKAWIELAQELLWAAPQHFGQFPSALREDQVWKENHRILVQAIRQNRTSTAPLDLRDLHHLTYAHAHPEELESQRLIEVVQRWLMHAPEVFLVCPPSIRKDEQWKDRVLRSRLL